MCNFISWIEYKKDLFYLDNNKLNTKEGRALVKYLKDNNSLEDMCGHGAVKRFYQELEGKDYIEKEVTDFSDPENFPKEIADKIKKGVFSEVYTRNIPLQLLNDLGKTEYKKIEQPAWAEYGKIQQTAWAEYKKIQQTAWAEYKKIEQPAFWDIFKNKKYRNKKWL